MIEFETVEKWVVDTMRRDPITGFRFERLTCASFEDAMDHALDIPIEWTKPHVRKVPCKMPIPPPREPMPAPRS